VKAREALWAERMEWAKMRMDHTDDSDGGDEWSFLLQGKRPDENWTGLFKLGERVRLRLINASPMNLYDVRIPGLPMTVVQDDGQNANPVEVDEFRIGNGETYDVIVQPKESRAYTIFVPTIARIGYARGTLAPELGMSAPVPQMGPEPLRTMADMGMSGGAMVGVDMGQAPAGVGHAGMAMPAPVKPADPHAGMPSMAAKPADPHAGMEMPAPAALTGGAQLGMPDMSAETSRIEPDADGLRRLKYAHLRAATRNADDRAPEKEVLVRLTGDMVRYFWGINGQKLSQAEPLEMGLGQRVRIKFVNETMMEHPMHLHGVFMELVSGNGVYAPRKRTIIVPPAQTVELDVTFEDEGMWAFHCHLFYHAATGMMRLVKVA
jgi:CopA family copper-resistance protein